MDWREDYKRKLVSVEEAVKTIQSGDTVHIPLGTMPQLLPAALWERRGELNNVHVEMTAPSADPGWFSPGDPAFNVDVINYLGDTARPALDEKRINYTCAMFRTMAIWCDRNMRLNDVMFAVLTPPNEKGFCSFGHSLWHKKSSATRAKRLIVEVDHNQRWCYGDNFIHVSEVDLFVEFTPPELSDEDLKAKIAKEDTKERQDKLWEIIQMFPPPQHPVILPRLLKVPTQWLDSVPRLVGLGDASPEEKAIAGFLSTLINDGDCIQLGVGTPTGYMPKAGAFDGRFDLGYHGEMCAGGIGKLVEAGVINGKRKTLHPGKAVASTWDGSTWEDLEVIADNPKFELYDSTYTVDPKTICKNDNQVAINNALSVDLTGQVNSETGFGSRIINGPGGQIDSHIGAMLSKGGKGVHLLPSTAVSGTVSRITPQFEQGAAVTISRHLADYVITEYGIASLTGKTFRQRADELIAIAHPDFRAELKKEAQKLFYP